MSIEWYPDRETIVALALYYKDIISYVVNGSTTEVFPGQFLPGTQPASCTPTGETGLYDCTYVVKRPVHGTGGTNKAIELQIGRRSGREGVWQEVIISVGREEYKKKRK